MAAITQARGMISAAARSINCAPSLIHRYKRKYPEIARVIRDARELQFDRAELKLFQLIDQGEFPAIALYLKTQGGPRRYVDKQDVSVKADVKTTAMKPKKVKWTREELVAECARRGLPTTIFKD